MNNEQRTKKAFTLVELIVAVAFLAIVLAFTGVIFNVSIEAYRTAGATAEIMQKLRAITDQLNRDFEGLCKDGYLILHSEELDAEEFEDSDSDWFRADRLYYFSTGDFQSWFEPDIRSNIARIYFGHDSNSLDSDRFVSKWNLARDVKLLTPGYSHFDCNDTSFAECKADLEDALDDPVVVLANGVAIDIDYDANDVRRLMCQNAGEMIIEWTDGVPDSNGLLGWYDEYDGPTSWTPAVSQAYWPKALKFTFTLYDSKGIFDKGKTFTHIVYIGD
jgi:prepilin-type N-terminal cleavage/methylation domain-containing protein